MRLVPQHHAGAGQNRRPAEEAGPRIEDVAGILAVFRTQIQNDAGDVSRIHFLEHLRRHHILG